MKEFAELVRQMRLAQRHTRRHKNGITETKRLERAVDDIIKDVLGIEFLNDKHETK